MRIQGIFAICLTISSSSPLAQQQVSEQKQAVTVPAGPQELHLRGLRGRVTVRRDERGIPYIDAGNQTDLYIAQGYVVASDRLWQMDLLRRTARGELSEILGPAALERDKLHRTFGFAALAEHLAERSPASLREVLDAYARGVNDYIESLNESTVPLECRVLLYKPRLWRPADSLILGKVFAEALTTSWQTDMMRAALADLPQARREALLPTRSPLDVILVGSDRLPAGGVVSGDDVTPNYFSGTGLTHAALNGSIQASETLNTSLRQVGLYAEELAASNNWAVSGKRTLSGRPLLANDPHLSPSTPSIWYMACLNAPGLHVAGVTVPGTPGIVIGHNEHIAWGMTDVIADVQDLYVERFDRNNPRRYLTPAGWCDAEERIENIVVRKTPMGSATEIVHFTVTSTRHGPILFEGDGSRYALAWTALDRAANEFDVYYFLNRARTWRDFERALGAYSGPPLNFVYADTEGHIGYWGAGEYPIRRAGHGTVPYDGTTAEGDWIGYIPFDGTPHVYDPESGIIATANNRVVGVDYPYYITDTWACPYRARRIYDLLSASTRLSVDDCRAIQADTYSQTDAIFVREVMNLARPLASSYPEWREIVATFDGCDAMLKANSHAMPFALAMHNEFRRRILAAALGPGRARTYNWPNSDTFFDELITARPREWLPPAFDSYEAMILACYRYAIGALPRRLGPDRSQWTWGRLALAHFPHPLENAPFIGARFTTPTLPEEGGQTSINRGESVSMRYIADVGSWDNTRQSISVGESGDPGSPHWTDQMPDWQSMRPRRFPFSKEAVSNSTELTLILSPAD
jgi:penicillin amidase